MPVVVALPSLHGELVLSSNLTVTREKYSLDDPAEIGIQLGHPVDVVFAAGLLVRESTTVIEFSSDSVHVR